VIGGGLYLLARRRTREYEEALRAGSWHFGLIVFPSGDVVVRDLGLFKNVDRTIESVYLSRADVERRCAPHRCGMRNFLRIYYLGVDARPSVISICETDLRDGVSQIADFINDLRSKQMAAY
jgi:hypothetical protein